MDTTLRRVNRTPERAGLPIRSYTATDLEYMTGVARTTWITWRSEGRGPAYIHLGGKKVVYPADKFDAWWNRQLEKERK